MHLAHLTILAVVSHLAAAVLPRDDSPTTLVAVPSAAVANAVATPSPIQPGMTSNCNSFHLVGTGDTCTTIASSAGISLANFYSWNSGVGTGCDTLWLGYYVCTGVSSTTTVPSTTTTTTTTTTSVATPSPTQSGMVSNCDAFYLVATGDTCTTVAQKKAVSVTDIVSWNPGVGTGCTNLWLGYYICVGVY
ncbi:LysM peptidoglycan-binding domain-containing protein [Aspergillus ibericus CBS 121593]|uniref:LysM domain-containing protein n=1 Tax=Aspergillus ibericus CBS 121593 TaxID=1448316 RepID=A0A395GIL0_9EURO|nr:hypothetical protein BO80DRAFT_266861 [Aspergillus ibericus CBS 121593]RAK95290.1 hypothetical protein BO80DRAFT_266861 [Aspergillus ibericus CBS 121593]